MGKIGKDKRLRSAPDEKNGATSTAQNKGLSGKLVVLILGVTLIIAVTVVVIVLLLREKPTEIPTDLTPNAEMSSLFYDDSNLDSVEEELRKKVAKGMFTTHMNTIWTFPDGESSSTDAVMGNSTANQYPFWFDVTVDGEVVFESSLIPVGSQIKEIVLSEDLEAGIYPAVIMIHMIDENNEPVENNMGINITLVIEK